MTSSPNKKFMELMVPFTYHSASPEPPGYRDFWPPIPAPLSGVFPATACNRFVRFLVNAKS